MISFFIRRLAISVFVLLGASFIIYMLIAYSGDPLEDLRGSNDPNKDNLIRNRINNLNLDVHPAARYFLWLGGASKCLIGQCDLGKSLDQQPVTEALKHAIPSTLQLVSAASVIAIIIGITIGVITALRQYSTFDYAVTFVSFLFFSLPVFWVAVLLKEFAAIRFNDFLAEATFSTQAIITIAVVSGLVWVIAIGGDWRRRAITFVSGAAATGAVFAYFSATKWFQTPRLGVVVIAVTGAAIAYGATSMFAGKGDRRALYASLTTAGVGVVLYFFMPEVFNNSSFSLWWLVGLLAVALAVAAVIGFAYGGWDRAQSIKASMVAAFGVSFLIVLDRFMQAWPAYNSSRLIRGRPIPTIGANTPGLRGSFWLHGVDRFTHLLLPTLALLLISLAGYTRYSRASMLEVLGQDYVRTARAKGLPERLVIFRHAFRNALLPLATVVAFDLGGLIGGAVITEYIFSIKGMGQLFIVGVYRTDPNPVMAVAVISGITAIVANLVADMMYSVLDPRVRVQ